MTFPAMLTEGTKETIFDWFQDREVTDEDKFNTWFNRTLNRDLPQYYQLLRLEPGFNESGVAQYDWFVEDYEEVERTHNGFNTEAGNHELAEIIKRAIGTTTKTEGADTDTSARGSVRNANHANAKNNQNNESIKYQGGQSKAESGNATGSKKYEGSTVNAENEAGTDNLAYKGGKSIAEAGTDGEKTNYTGSKKTTDVEATTDNTAYNGGTERTTNGTGSDILTYAGTESEIRTPELTHTEVNTGSSTSDSTEKNAQKSAPMSNSYAESGTSGNTLRSSAAVSGNGQKLQNFDWASMTAQVQKDTGSKDDTNNSSATVDSGKETRAKSFDNRNDSRNTANQETVKDTYSGRNDAKNGTRAHVTEEDYDGRYDEKKGNTNKASIEQYNDRSDDRTSSNSRATIESFNDRKDTDSNSDNRVSIEQFNDRSDTKAGGAVEAEAGSDNENLNEAEVQTHAKGTTVTVTPDSNKQDSNNRTVNDIAIGTDNNTDHEQRTGRHGYPSDILEHAYSFIKASSAWIWLSDRLEICFMQVI